MWDFLGQVAVHFMLFTFGLGYVILLVYLKSRGIKSGTLVMVFVVAAVCLVVNPRGEFGTDYDLSIRGYGLIIIAFSIWYWNTPFKQEAETPPPQKLPLEDPDPLGIRNER